MYIYPKRCMYMKNEMKRDAYVFALHKYEMRRMYVKRDVYIHEKRCIYMKGENEKRCIYICPTQI